MKLNATRAEKIEELMNGLHKFSIKGVKYNATLDSEYIPYLDVNKSNMRKNHIDNTEITFFDCNTNDWVTVEHSEVTK